MFKVNISNASKNLSWSAQFPTEIEAQEWLSKQIGKPWRKPAYLDPVIDESGNPVLDDNGDPTNVLIPAEFSSEIINLSLDQVWVEQDISQKREKEYPSINLVVEALIEAIAENRPQKLNEIQALRQAVKNKYPKGSN